MRNVKPAPGARGAKPFVKRKFYARKKYCRFCANAELEINYKDQRLLKGFISERGKIIPRRISGACAAHQRTVAKAIKRARNLALLPLCAEHKIQG